MGRVDEPAGAAHDGLAGRPDVGHRRVALVYVGGEPVELPVLALHGVRPGVGLGVS